VTLIEDHPATLAGVQAWLADADPPIRVVASGHSARAAWLPPGDAADVVVLDLNSGPATSYADLRRLARDGRRLVIYTDAETAVAARTCLELGAATVVSKFEGATVLIAAIVAVSQDRPYLSPALTAKLAGRRVPARPLLSNRERQVLLAWLRCDSKTLVARELQITTRTVVTYVDRIRLKYAGVGRPAPTKAGLLARALQDGLVDLDDL
jgi:two-component system, NarL family, nitrate/nitrite response regulator NarL